MSSEPKRGIWRVFLILLFIMGLSFLSIILMGRFQSARAVAQEGYQYLEIFNQALDVIEKKYVKEIDAKTLIYGAIQGMLYKLDPHSIHLQPDYAKDLQVDLTGEFGGLGIEVGIKGGYITIISPIEDTPAWKAGLKAGDMIFKIDGQSTEGMSLLDGVHKMRGKKGTPVTLTIVREGWKEPRNFTLVRDIIKIKSVKQAEVFDGKYGYIRLITFNENTGKDLREAMKKLMSQTQGKLAGLILDIRNNPGGPLEQALEASDLFLSEGTIVSIKGRSPEDNQAFYAHKENTYSGFPIIVMLNSGSASASEIVAAALKDSGRAVILGDKSYGKGSVQSLYTLKDGSMIKLTTAYYYTPSGKSIQAEGIRPDIEVEELSPEQIALLKEERQKEEALRIKEQDLPGYTPHQEVEPKSKPKSEEVKSQEPKSFKEQVLNDYQLRRAVELIKAWEIFQAQYKKASSQ